MIIHIEKGIWLTEGLRGIGYHYVHLDNIPTAERIDGQPFTPDDEIIVNDFIVAFDPLPNSQKEAIKTLGQYADELINAKINPIKQRRLNADAINASIKKGKGVIDAADQAKLDNYEEAMFYPDAIFAQYDIEEAAILTQTDWTLINMEAAKANLDVIV